MTNRALKPLLRKFIPMQEEVQTPVVWYPPRQKPAFVASFLVGLSFGWFPGR